MVWGNCLEKLSFLRVSSNIKRWFGQSIPGFDIFISKIITLQIIKNILF